MCRGSPILGHPLYKNILLNVKIIKRGKYDIR